MVIGKRLERLSASLNLTLSLSANRLRVFPKRLSTVWLTIRARAAFKIRFQQSLCWLLSTAFNGLEAFTLCVHLSRSQSVVAFNGHNQKFVIKSQSALNLRNQCRVPKHRKRLDCCKHEQSNSSQEGSLRNQFTSPTRSLAHCVTFHMRN